MTVKKWAMAAATAAALGASTSAMAGAFWIDVSAYDATKPNPILVDEIVANYREIVTFTSDTEVKLSLRFNVGQFVLDDTPVNTGVGANYGMYGLFTGTGTFDPVANTITLVSGSADYTLWVDANFDTTFTDPASGANPWILGNTSDDVLLVTGDVLNGAAQLIAGCPFNNCGSVGQITTVELTSDGENFFVSPDPFYALSLQTAQLTQPIVTGNGAQTIMGGSFNITFVPEPGSLALAGLALVGVASTMRKRRA